MIYTPSLSRTQLNSVIYCRFQRHAGSLLMMGC